METVKDRIMKHNVNAWDSATEEAWMTVKDCMYKILSKPDDAVGSIDGGGKLNRWGIISGVASIYACVITPLRVSRMVGFEYIFTLLDALVVVIFATELILGNIILRFVKTRDVRMVYSRKFQRTNLFGKGILVLRYLGIHEAVNFPISNLIFILSYLLQYQAISNDDVYGGSSSTNNGSSWFGSSTFEATTPDTSGDLIVGVYWTWAFGIFRLVAIFRAVAAIRQLELSYTLYNQADTATRITMRTARLVLGLAYTSHVAACLYVLVARIELGPEAYYDVENPEQLATQFFPDYTILGKMNMPFTNYVRCVHFAFTNLAGIGNHESIPHSTLECLFTLAVNALGATLYAFTTSLLLSMIEPSAERANHFGDSAAALQEFMTEIGMDADDRDRVIQGFILREMSGGTTSTDDGPFAPAPGQNAAAPPYPTQLIQNLPRYLQDELHTVSLADAIKRRERAFRRCSNEFLTAIASSLKQSIILLPGDFIVREGDSVPAQMMIVEEGSLEVIVGGTFIHEFVRGDMISFRWVDHTKSSIKGRQYSESSSFSPLLLSDNIACASVRSMDVCKIAAGLTSKDERKDIKRRYPNDWNELKEVLDNARNNAIKPREEDDFTKSTIDTADTVSTLGASNRSKHSITERVRRFSSLASKKAHIT